MNSKYPIKYPNGFKFYTVSNFGGITQYEVLDYAPNQAIISGYKISVLCPNRKTPYETTWREPWIDAFVNRVLTKTTNYEFLDYSQALQDSLTRLQRRADKINTLIQKTSYELTQNP